MRTVRAISFLGVLVVFVAAPSIGQSDDTFLAFKSEPGDLVGAGGSGRFEASDGTFDVQFLPWNEVRFTFRGGGSLWTVDFEARDGVPLVPGPYPGATDFRYHSPTKPGVRVTNDGRECDWAVGKFDLYELVMVAGGIKKLAVDVEQHCEGASELLHVELRYNASEVFQEPPNSDTDTVPDSIDNCIKVYNPSQSDEDSDLLGDSCDSVLDNTFLSFSSEPGDPLAGGSSFKLYQKDGRFSIERKGESSVTLGFDGDTDWKFFFGAAEGERLEPGLYEGALPPDAVGPELLVASSGSPCQNPSGLFEVHEIQFSGGGSVSRLAVDYVQSCDGAPPLRGSVRYNASEFLLTRPKPGSTLTDSTVVFEWSDHVSTTKDFKVYVGTTKGGTDILDSGYIGPRTSLEVSGLPNDGRPVWLRLWMRTARVLRAADFQFTSVSMSFIPEITSPLPSSTLPGSAARFEWTANGLEVSSWTLLLGSAPGQSNLFKSGPTTDTYADVTGLPTDGSPVYAKLWYVSGGVWSYEEFVYTADPSGGTPEIVEPRVSDVLPGSEVTFVWEPKGSIVSQWHLLVGTYAGASDLFRSDPLSPGTTSLTVSGLPTDGTRLYVRLWYVNGRWNSKDYVFTTSDAGGPPAIVSPSEGEALPGSEVTFEWARNGSYVSQWQLLIGTYPGARDLYDSGALAASSTGLTVTGLPTDGSPLYVRLWYVNARWNALDYVFQADDSGGTPEIVSPAPGSVLSGADVDVSLATNGSAISSWRLGVGSYPGGADLFTSGAISPATPSFRVTGLPTDGSPVYVRLWWVAGQWYHKDYEYVANASGGTAALVSPAPGSTLAGGDAVFTWAPNGSRVTAWLLELGTQSGIYDLYKSDLLPGDTTSIVVTGLPSDGTKIYGRLWYVTGRWNALTFELTTSSSGGQPSIVTPLPGSQLTGSSIEITWTTGGSLVRAWWVNAGSAPGSNDYFNSGELPATARSVVVQGLPVDASQVWIQLWYRTSDGTWTRVDQWFTAAGGSVGDGG